MGTSTPATLNQDLQTLFGEGAVGGLSDGQLLGRFAVGRDEAAFEALLQRHGRMVWGVCRRILRNHDDAEDAFQATFLVLARKASSIAHRELVANWLYAVAYKSAKRASAMASKRRARERQVTEIPEPEAGSEATRNDLLSRLDHELSRLPEKYRAPIVLCELERKTHREAAEQLGWPVGTVSGRLSRARAMLAKRLSRPGVSLAVGSLAVMLARDTAAASMPAKLIGPTTQAASLSVIGRAVTAGVVSANVATLTGELIKMMILPKLKIVTVVLLALACTGIGAVMESSAPAMDQEPSSPKAEIGAEDLAKEDIERLQGTWVVMTVEEEGRQETWKSTDRTIIIKNEELLINFGRIRFWFRFRLAPKQKPKRMRLERDGSSIEGRYIQAIYRLDEDILLINMGRPGDEEPPADFSTKNDGPGTPTTLLVLKRKPILSGGVGSDKEPRARQNKAEAERRAVKENSHLAELIHKKAQAELRSAESKIHKAKADLRKAEGELRSAIAELGRAEKEARSLEGGLDK